MGSIENYHHHPIFSQTRSAMLSSYKRHSLISSIVDAINGLHSQGFAHRDLKPDNIMSHQPEEGGDPIYKISKSNQSTLITLNMKASAKRISEVFTMQHQKFKIQVWAQGLARWMFGQLESFSTKCKLFLRWGILVDIN